MESVEALVLVVMLGVTVGVVASLLTVALCHYLCVAFGVESFLRIAESEYLLDVHPCP